MEQKSKCCGASLVAITSDEGTGYWMCAQCKNPTDPMTLPEDVRGIDIVKLADLLNDWKVSVAFNSDTGEHDLDLPQINGQKIVSYIQSLLASAKAEGYQEGVKAMAEEVKKMTHNYFDKELGGMNRRFITSSDVNQCADQLLQ